MAKGNFWLGMIVGAAAGAVSALMYAPKRGTEFRQDVKQTVQETGRKAGRAWGGLKDRTTSMASKSGDTVRQSMDKGRETVSNLRSRINEAIQAGRSAADEKKAELQAQLDTEKNQRTNDIQAI